MPCQHKSPLTNSCLAGQCSSTQTVLLKNYTTLILTHVHTYSIAHIRLNFVRFPKMISNLKKLHFKKTIFLSNWLFISAFSIHFHSSTHHHQQQEKACHKNMPIELLLAKIMCPLYYKSLPTFEHATNQKKHPHQNLAIYLLINLPN